MEEGGLSGIGKELGGTIRMEMEVARKLGEKSLVVEGDKGEGGKGFWRKGEG